MFGKKKSYYLDVWYKDCNFAKINYQRIIIFFFMRNYYKL